MALTVVSRRSASLAALFLLLLLATWTSGCLGCGGETESAKNAPERALRASFPEHAAKVLEQGNGFVAEEQGFALDGARASGGWHQSRLEVELPRDAAHAVLFRGAEGFEVRVRESGVEGEGAIAGRAVAYRRARGTSFWTATAGGAE